MRERSYEEEFGGTCSEGVSPERQRKMAEMFAAQLCIFEQKCKELKRLNFLKLQLSDIASEKERAEKRREIDAELTRVNRDALACAKEVIKNHTDDESLVKKMLETVEHCWNCRRAAKLPKDNDGKLICFEKCLDWEILFELWPALYGVFPPEPTAQEIFVRMIKQKEREVNFAMYR